MLRYTCNQHSLLIQCAQYKVNIVRKGRDGVYQARCSREAALPRDGGGSESCWQLKTAAAGAARPALAGPGERLEGARPLSAALRLLARQRPGCWGLLGAPRSEEKPAGLLSPAFGAARG